MRGCSTGYRELASRGILEGTDKVAVVVIAPIRPTHWMSAGAGVQVVVADVAGAQGLGEGQA